MNTIEHDEWWTRCPMMNTIFDRQKWTWNTAQSYTFSKIMLDTEVYWFKIPAVSEKACEAEPLWETDFC